jgi:hypothetical protein
MHNKSTYRRDKNVIFVVLMLFFPALVWVAVFGGLQPPMVLLISTFTFDEGLLYLIFFVIWAGIFRLISCIVARIIAKKNLTHKQYCSVLAAGFVVLLVVLRISPYTTIGHSTRNLSIIEVYRGAILGKF